MTMDLEELKDQLENAAGDETKEQVNKAFKVVQIMIRRLGALEKSDYNPDEIVLGTALALSEVINRVDDDRKEKIKQLTARIVGL